MSMLVLGANSKYLDVGMEVTYTYNQKLKSPWDLLNGYGFFLENNPYREGYIKLKLDGMPEEN